MTAGLIGAMAARPAGAAAADARGKGDMRPAGAAVRDGGAVPRAPVNLSNRGD